MCVFYPSKVVKPRKWGKHCFSPISCDAPLARGVYTSENPISFYTILTVLFNILFITWLIHYYNYIKVIVLNIITTIYAFWYRSSIGLLYNLPLGLNIFTVVNLLYLLYQVYMITFYCALNFEEDFYINLNSNYLDNIHYVEVDNYSTSDRILVHLSIPEGESGQWSKNGVTPTTNGTYNNEQDDSDSDVEDHFRDNCNQGESHRNTNPLPVPNDAVYEYCTEPNPDSVPEDCDCSFHDHCFTKWVEENR
jgi:hypothetical protein